MALNTEVKQQVREFYDQVGWQQVSDGIYQNARYEDLRPVAREYIHRCHLRVNRHLSPQGKLLLDAGSGPIQYPEYLTYSQGYQGRVCADISIVALQEARKRIGDAGQGGHGMFVVADIANLPFKAESFDGIVSLHTIHHVPEKEHPQAYRELFRVLASQRSAVVVNGWDSPPLGRIFSAPVGWVHGLRRGLRRMLGKPVKEKRARDGKGQQIKGTFIRKNDAASLKREIGSLVPLKIFVWRSVSVRVLRTFVHPQLGGKYWLRLLYALEERFPRFFGENGQYPLVVLRKP